MNNCLCQYPQKNLSKKPRGAVHPALPPRITTTNDPHFIPHPFHSRHTPKTAPHRNDRWGWYNQPWQRVGRASSLDTMGTAKANILFS